MTHFLLTAIYSRVIYRRWAEDESLILWRHRRISYTGRGGLESRGEEEEEVEEEEGGGGEGGGEAFLLIR